MVIEVLFILFGMLIISIVINQKKNKPERKSMHDLRTKKYYQHEFTAEDRLRWLANQHIEIDTDLDMRCVILMARTFLLTKELWLPIMFIGTLVMCVILLIRG